MASLLAFGTAIALVACQSYESGSKEAFSKSHTCPLDRIQAIARPDLKNSMLTAKSEPSPEIKADPGRLKMWEEKEAKTAAQMDDICEIWEAKGCDKHEMQCCSRPGRKQHKVTCSGRAVDRIPAGLTKL